MTANNPVPTLIAHRGYAFHYPENSLEGLQAAVIAGARFVEFDVQLSCDGVPLVIHDASLERTAGQSGNVMEMTAGELTQVAVGEPDRFGDRYKDVMLPSLAQAVDWLQRYSYVTAFVELKQESIEAFGILSVLKSVSDILAPVKRQTVLISYNAELVRTSKTQAYKTGWVLPAWSEELHTAANELAPDYLFANQKRLPALPQPLWAGPWHWAVYEITESQQALNLAARGVGFIETMRMAEMLKDSRLHGNG